MSLIEPLDCAAYSDDELRQQYSLTYKIKCYYESCKLGDMSSQRMYNALILQAESDLQTLQNEFQHRDLEVPTVSDTVEKVDAAEGETGEKNEEATASEEEEAPPPSNGQVSYQEPVIVRKLEDTDSHS